MIVVLDDDAGLIVHRRSQRPQRRDRIGLIVDVVDQDVVKCFDVTDIVACMDLEPQVRKTTTGEVDLPRAEVDTEAKAWRNGVEEIGREAADLQDAFAGWYDEAEKLENLIVIVCVPGDVVGAALAYPLVVLPDLLYAAFEGGGPEPAG